ncbi:MAG: AAA family ATPase [Woeseiaceae bacterium]|nr:AAA family ATPase [Woeseiaceae bacterium]
MYTRFFGLNEKPFAITPDPRYLFMSERHGEGLAHLIYGVTESGGFIQLTGEVGTGKTTLVRTLLGQLPDEVDVALILNPQLTALEFLLAICEELDVALPADSSSKKALVDALNRHLLDAHARGRRTILLVDEAQNLSADVLEQVRLLTNLETAKQKLLQIILIGQPELRAVLGQANLRQLAQRVTGRYHLEPLSRDEAVRYIDHRLKVAGALTEIFEPSAKRAVHRRAGGIPRLMNVICDRALLGAYSAESRQVTRDVVRRAAAEVAGSETAPMRGGLLPAALAATAIAIVAGVVAWASLGTGPGDAQAGPATTPVVTTAPAVEPAGEPPVATNADNASPPPVPLGAVLERGGATLDAAMDNLLALWGETYDPAAGNGCDQAAAAGLSCLYQRGSWNTVRQLDRPAVLTLTDQAGATHHVVLAGIAGDTVELRVGDTPLSVPADDLTDLWFGQYLLLWRPPNGAVTALQPGTRGANVVWLRQSLASLGAEVPAGESGADFFDATLESELRAFQRRQRLQVDGLAGERTQIRINSLLGDENSPRLTGAPR